MSFSTWGQRRMGKEIKHQVQAGWNNWRSATPSGTLTPTIALHATGKA